MISMTQIPERHSQLKKNVVISLQKKIYIYILECFGNSPLPKCSYCLYLFKFFLTCPFIIWAVFRTPTPWLIHIKDDISESTQPLTSAQQRSLVCLLICALAG